MNQLVVLVNLIGLFLVDLFLVGDISIEHKSPASMAPGSEVKVTVTVNKGDLGGFAKLQIDLPPGLSAAAIETKGASFTFADGKAKFIWMSLPTSPSFSVSYNLIADPTASGDVPINARLSYIENNERKTFEMPTVFIDLGNTAQVKTAPAGNMGDDLVSAAGAAPIAPEEAATATEPTVNEPVVETAGTAPQTPITVSSSRSITPVNDTEFLVEVTLRKGELRGFGKLQETIPAGFTAIEKNSEDAIFTANDRVVKFVWLNLPAREELKVAYRIRANDRTAGDRTVTGEFGYLLNDETQKHPVTATTFTIAAQDVAVVTPPTVVVDTPKPVLSTPVVTPPVEKPIAKVDPPKPEPKVTGVPGPEQGVTYKVQITAAHKEVGAEYFLQRHKYSGPFGLERHEGWIKYTTGRFPEYRQARDQREAFISAGHRFPGPFVTAYNNGERITVQEALMISRQQWVQ